MSYDQMDSDPSGEAFIDDSSNMEEKTKDSSSIKKGLSKMLKKDAFENAFEKIEKIGKRKPTAPTIEPIFGAPLAKTVEATKLRSNSYIPAIVEQCIDYMNKRALDEEGIYRVPGSTSQVNNLKSLFNSGQKVNLEDHVTDPHSVAGLLKLYYRELPEPLLTLELSKKFQDVGTIQDDHERVDQIIKLLNTLPIENVHTLKAIIDHLILVSKHSDSNKMTMSNLGVVFSACLDIPGLVFKSFMVDSDKIFKSVTMTPKEEQPPPRPLRTSSLPSNSANNISSNSAPNVSTRNLGSSPSLNRLSTALFSSSKENVTSSTPLSATPPKPSRKPVTKQNSEESHFLNSNSGDSIHKEEEDLDFF